MVYLYTVTLFINNKKLFQLQAKNSDKFYNIDGKSKTCNKEYNSIRIKFKIR